MKLNDYIRDFDLVGVVLSKAGISTDTHATATTRLLLTHGNGEVYEAFQRLELEVVADVIAETFSDKWSAIITAHDLVGDGAVDHRLITETIHRDRDTTSTTERTDKTAAYNVVELIDEGGSAGTETSGLGEVVERTTKDENINIGELFSNVQLAHKNSIINVVMRDIAAFLILNVY